MSRIADYPMTHQGVRDLDNPRRSNPVNVGPEERAASIFGGAFLAGFALGKGDFLGMLLGTVAGVGLAYRGLTGHCSCYAATGVNTAKRRGHVGYHPRTSSN